MIDHAGYLAALTDLERRYDGPIPAWERAALRARHTGTEELPEIPTPQQKEAA